MLDKKIKAKWLEALRSGEYRQGEEILYDKCTNSYCCLGVLCKITNTPLMDSNGIAKNYPIVNSNSIFAPDDPLPFLGISKFQQEKLATMNDEEKCNFKEIASYISKNL